MCAEISQPVETPKIEPRGEEEAEPVREILEVGLSSPTGELNESATSNVMEILSHAGMETVMSGVKPW